MKRFLSAVLLAALLALPTAAAASLTTSNLPNGGVTIAVDGDTCTVSGAIRHTNMDAVWIHVGEENKVLSAQSGQAFQYTVHLQGDGDREVTIYTRQNGAEMFWSYLWRTVKLHKTAAGWQIEDTDAYGHNQRIWETTWVNPGDCLGDVDPTVAAKAWEIVGTEADDYARLQKLYGWVAENLYYGTGTDGSLPLTAAEVLANGYTVCEGYTNLLVDLCRAVGIPCMQVHTWSAGDGSDGYVSSEDTQALLATEDKIGIINHAHAAAWVNGRWIHMDPTWDSSNRYVNGQKTKESASGWMYFDATLDYLSRSHLILQLPCAAEAADTPSDWAMAEVRTALEKELIPLSQQERYTEQITRGDFCTLLMTMLVSKTNSASIEALLTAKGVTTDPATFTDVAAADSTAILAANALGIVNGRGNGIFDPQSPITRQEAAAMLMRAAQVLGIEMGDEPMRFADMGEAADWAAIGILYTSSLVSESGKAVMGGVSETKFSPLTGYTREQAMLTMVRLWGVREFNIHLQ